MILKIVWRHLKSRPLSGFFTLIAITLVLTLLGSFWTLVENISRVQKTVNAEENSSLTLFLKPDLSASAVDDIKKKLKDEKLFDKITVINPEEALKELEKKYGQTLAKTLSAESLPITMKLNLSSQSVPQKLLKSIMENLKKNPSVIDIDDGRLLFEKSDESTLPTAIIKWATILFIIIFSIVALLVSHLIRLVFESSRRDMETMKILGASRSFIFFPLLIEGLIYGALGAILSLVALWISVKEVLPRIASALLPQQFDVFFLSTSSWLGVIAVAIGASMLGALFTWPLVKSSPKEIT
jgi:cell division transport system permease protein